MTLAFDFIGTNIGSGTKSYNINFCNELENTELKENILIFLTKIYYSQINFNEKKNPKIKYIIKSNLLSNIFIRLIWMQLIFPFELKLLSAKKLYSPMNFCPFFLKLFNIKVILALQSNLPWVFFNTMPGNKLRNLITRKFMEISISSCNLLIVDSNFAKSEISNILSIKKDKIEVIYLGLDKKFFSLKDKNNFIKNFNYEEKYLLSVISCVKYHNILNLLKAFRKFLNENNEQLKFVFVMQILDKKYFKTLDSYIKKNFKKEEIIILKNLESKNLPNLYKYSQLYLFSSYSEVFGLTSIEAMSQGCPVLISNTSALPEINGSSCCYFNPDNIDEINKKIKEILINKEYRNELINNGFKHFKKFSWENNVKETLDKIYNL